MLLHLCMDLLDAVIDGQLWQKQGNMKCPRKNSVYRNNCLYNKAACTTERNQGMDWMAGTSGFVWNNLAATSWLFHLLSYFFIYLEESDCFGWGEVRWSGLPPLGSVDVHVDPNIDKLKTDCALVLCCEVWPLCLVIPHREWHLSERAAGFTVHLLLPPLFFLAVLSTLCLFEY